MVAEPTGLPAPTIVARSPRIEGVSCAPGGGLCRPCPSLLERLIYTLNNQIADLHWSDQPPARSDQSLYAYYTLDPASPPNNQEAVSGHNPAHAMSTNADASSNALALGFGADGMDDASWKAMLEQWNDATHLDLLEYDGQPYLSLPSDGVMFPVDVPSYLSPTSQPSQPYPTNSSVASPLVMNKTHEDSPPSHFPPIPPPASSLPIPSCLREDLPSLPVAPGITGEQEYIPIAFRPTQPASKVP